MPRATANGIEFEYDTFGDPGSPPLLLVMGLGAQLIHWDEDFCERLAATGRFVIRYDNRDAGRSTHLDNATVDLMALLGSMGNPSADVKVPYRLTDLAADGIGLLDHLGIEQADIVGASMGGMIVQTMAIEHPTRVRTLTSIMSMSGEPGYGQAAPEATAMLMQPPPTDREGYIERMVADTKLIGSQRYVDEAETRRLAAIAFDRAFYPQGTVRQLAAILASPDRAAGLRELRVPTLVIHGRTDTLIALSGGERTAELVPGARLLVFNDMGHDLPRPLWPLVVDAIDSHCRHAID